jgi:hypothetical protein
MKTDHAVHHYPAPARSDAAVAPSSIKAALMENFFSYSQIHSPPHDMSRF